MRTHTQLDILMTGRRALMGSIMIVCGLFIVALIILSAFATPAMQADHATATSSPMSVSMQANTPAGAFHYPLRMTRGGR